MSGRWKRILALGAAVVLCLIAAAQMGSLFHWKVTCTPAAFAESSRRLSNPDRGFYYIYGYRITDEPVDYATDLRDRTREDDATRLGMMQINLREYRTGAISEEGLSNVRQLFAAMADSDKKWIVRFLYDWNGENEQYEPENLDIILQHMEQVGDVLREYHSCIYTLQGLFIGNWGEMNGTKYTDPDSMRELAARLADVSDASTFLSVRTPAQWRKITGEAAPDGWTENPLAKRLGLFNDGMLGSVSDYGTYSDNTRQDAGDFSAWTREEELAFQDVLCSSVPSGGEVIVDNPYNDLENTIADLKTMHVSYLNEDYDRNVLDKWAGTVVNTDDCYDGMDGWSYVERHLGYRLWIAGAALSHSFWADTVEVNAALKNSGFAPFYRQTKVCVSVTDEAGAVCYTDEWEEKLLKLSGGNEGRQELALTGTIRSAAGRAGLTGYISILAMQTAGNRFYLQTKRMPQKTDTASVRWQCDRCTTMQVQRLTSAKSYKKSTSLYEESRPQKPL